MRRCILLLLCLCALPACTAAAAQDRTARRGEPFLALLKSVYSLEGAEDFRDGNACFIPQKPGLAPIALTGEPPADTTSDPSVEATLRQPYPMGREGRYPEKGHNPGRLRNEALLKALYGADAAEVRASCESVDFLGQEVLFNRRQGASAALKRVVARLRVHLAAHPADLAYLLPSPGAFAWRPVKDTGRLSAHAFGIAVDCNVDKGPYWLWNPPPDRVAAARERYPQAIVDAFEAEGFIWGGKWDSFDFMHFEYRPELLSPARPVPPAMYFLLTKPRPDN